MHDLCCAAIKMTSAHADYQSVKENNVPWLHGHPDAFCMWSSQAQQYAHKAQSLHLAATMKTSVSSRLIHASAGAGVGRSDCSWFGMPHLPDGQSRSPGPRPPRGCHTCRHRYKLKISCRLLPCTENMAYVCSYQVTRYAPCNKLHLHFDTQHICGDAY